MAFLEKWGQASLPCLYTFSKLCVKPSLGVTLSDGELAKLWVTTGDMELSGFVREHLNSRVGVVSLSSNALVPTMWAHYAQNTGVVVGYDTEALAKLGFDLRSVVYLDIPPMWQPTRGDVIEAAFADRESTDRAAAAGKVVLGYHILCSQFNALDY